MSELSPLANNLTQIATALDQAADALASSPNLSAQATARADAEAARAAANLHGADNANARTQALTEATHKLGGAATTLKSNGLHEAANKAFDSAIYAANGIPDTTLAAELTAAKADNAPGAQTTSQQPPIQEGKDPDSK